mmetsp:Transcript_4255/g.13472  ORF Transcript_4255/g.13472 Transcript_4255/m.13472 type:complete len:213 (-) Transcript_4255:120-758(-)
MLLLPLRSVRAKGGRDPRRRTELARYGNEVEDIVEPRERTHSLMLANDVEGNVTGCALVKVHSAHCFIVVDLRDDPACVLREPLAQGDSKLDTVAACELILEVLFFVLRPALIAERAEHRLIVVCRLARGAAPGQWRVLPARLLHAAGDVGWDVGRAYGALDRAFIVVTAAHATRPVKLPGRAAPTAAPRATGSRRAVVTLAAASRSRLCRA